MKRLAIIFLAALMCWIGSGCGNNNEPAQAQVSGAPETPTIADPAQAIEEIYETIEIEGIEAMTDEVLADKFFIDLQYVDRYYARYSTGRFGVADVFILRPKRDMTMKVREALEQVKLNRIREFENYDIYNAYQIAQDAQVFEQGGYVILLMVEDMEGARAIIDRCIPKT